MRRLRSSSLFSVTLLVYLVFTGLAHWMLSLLASF